MTWTNTPPSAADISMPLVKASSAITAAAVAKADVADQVALAATSNSIPWGTIASIVAVIYTMLPISEWLWKKSIRPFAESRGWISKRKRRIYTLEELQDMDTERGGL